MKSAEASVEERQSVRIGLAFVAACTTAVALYAVLRLVQVFGGQEPDPALAAWSEHAGFFWRALIAGYVGGMVAFPTWLASERSSPRVAAALAHALPAAAALLAAQALFVP